MSDPITQLRYNQTTQVIEGTTGSAGWQTLPIVASGEVMLTNTHILVGNASNLATDVALSGDAAITNLGVLTISAGAIVDSKVSASAAIALSKLAALTANIVPITNGSGILTSSATTATELGFVHGVTSAIQTQLGTKVDTAGTGISIAGTTASNTGVLSVHADAQTNITGNVQLVSGTGISLSQSGQGITVNNTGVTSPNTVTVTNSTVDFFTTNSATYVDTGFGVTITPSSTSAKIRIDVQVQTNPNLGGSSGVGNVVSTILRGIGGTDLSGGKWLNSLFMTNGTGQNFTINFYVIDSPNTTSAVTYEFYVKVLSGSTLSFRMNDGGGLSSITATEIH